MSPADISANVLPELVLLPKQEPISSRHVFAVGLISIAVHIVLGYFFLSLPEVVPPKRASVVTSDLRKAVHIVYPRTFEPTQKAPNLKKVVRPELDVRSEVEMTQSQAPKFRPPQPAPGPIAKSVPPPAPPPVIDPPKIQVAATPQAPPAITPVNPTGTVSPAPPPPESSKPKIAFENVAPAARIKPNNGPVDPRLLMQRAAIERQQQNEPQKPSGGGGVIVGDTGDDLSNLPNLSPTQSKGRMGSNLQLLSDANGYDFKPYLLQVLASVKRNWLTVIPESAHMGRRGQVLLQFIIDRRGGVPKLVIATSSGTEAFDRAAVAGVSMSNPFPPLPADFKGDQIRVQLAFSYNAPR
jgi:TonB family protein